MSQEKIPIRFDGQAAIVTGSGGGIGRAIWPVIDDMGGCQIDDSNADAMAMYTDAFPFAGGGVPKLDQGAVVGAGKANQDDSQLGDE